MSEGSTMARRRTASIREKQIAELLDAGHSLQETADVLGIGRATVETHHYKATRRRGDSARLSRRQREVVSCLAVGLTTEEVAAHLGIALGTAVNHRTLASLTIGVRSVVGLTHYAIVRGWVQAGDALSADRMEAALRRIRKDAAATPGRGRPAR
jgi:DNA-binding CsgD family transcriptional regulator